MPAMRDRLLPQGRFAVISYHSARTALSNVRFATGASPVAARLASRYGHVAARWGAPNPPPHGRRRWRGRAKPAGPEREARYGSERRDPVSQSDVAHARPVVVAAVLIGFVIVTTAVIWRRGYGVARAEEMRALIRQRDQLRAERTSLERRLVK